MSARRASAPVAPLGRVEVRLGPELDAMVCSASVLVARIAVAVGASVPVALATLAVLRALALW